MDSRLERFPERSALNRGLTFSTLDAMLAWVTESARHYGHGYYAHLGCAEYEALWSVTEFTSDAMDALAEGGFDGR